MLSIRLTDAEYENIAEKAAAVELTVPAYLRQLALKQKIIQPLMPKEQSLELVFQIKAIGNNINQLTKLAHERKVHVVGLSEIREDLDLAWQQLRLVIQKSRQG